MSAQIAQRFAAIDRRSNGSHRVSLVYNAASNPNPNPIPLLLPQSLLPSPASPTPLPRFASSEGIGTTRPVASTSPQSPSHNPPSLARILPFQFLPPLLTDKRRIPLRSASVRTPHLFHHGIPKVLVNPRSKGITSVRSTTTH
jgi:hypothetical protein